MSVLKARFTVLASFGSSSLQVHVRSSGWGRGKPGARPLTLASVLGRIPLVSLGNLPLTTVSQTPGD